MAFVHLVYRRKAENVSQEALHSLDAERLLRQKTEVERRKLEVVAHEHHRYNMESLFEKRLTLQSHHFSMGRIMGSSEQVELVLCCSM